MVGSSARSLLSRPLLEPLPSEALLSTLCHEMVHALVDRVLGINEVHGPHFRARMQAINSSQEASQVSVLHRYLLPASSARWLAHCPRCAAPPLQTQGVPGRPAASVAIAFMGGAVHGGRWHRSCLLRFEPVDGGTL